MNEPLVLQVIPSLAVGGAERFAIELASRLPKYGFRTKIVVLYERGTFWEEVRKRNIRWVQVLPSREGSRLELMRTLSKIIYPNEIVRRPAIVHAHLFGGDFWSMVVKTLHQVSHIGVKDPYDPLFVSTAHNIDRDTLLGRISRRWAVKRFHRVVGVSESVRDYTVSALGVRPERAFSIDGMNFLEAEPKPRVPFHRPARLITVSRLVPQKGHDTLLRALAGIDQPFMYTIVGSGPLERSLKELVEELGLASRVRFLGSVTDVVELLHSSDLFLFPSRWEGLGSAVLEAASVELPALVSDLPCLANVFPKAQRVPVGNVVAWQKTLRLALTTPEKIFKQTDRLAKRIRSRFHPDVVTEAYAELYRSLISPRL